MATNRIPCEFHLIRYVPDVVKGEFTNIGVLLREVALVAGSPPRLRFTRDWSRVRCVDTDADVALLEALEAEMLARLQTEAAGTYGVKPLLEALCDSLSNSIQISEPRACLAENLTVELDQLMRLYVEPIRVKVTRQRTGRAAIAAAMRREFELTGVWALMRKRIAAAQYTRPGDPMKLDCGYRPNGVVRLFHAVSLDGDAEAAKGLAYTAPQLREGLVRVEGAALDLAAVVEPLRNLSLETGAEDDFSDEAADRYRFGLSTMESAGIRVLTVNDLARAAETARIELRL